MKPRTWACEYPPCAFEHTDAETVFFHMLSVHPERRRSLVSPHPDRRAADAVSPVLRRFREAAERGEGLHRGQRGAA